jgi:choline dehydrogenase-like flavoprotein
MNSPEFDIIVIGSGAGGGAVAWGLARHGFTVLVLEAGPAYDPFTDYLLDKPEWEQQAFPDRAKHKSRYTYGPMQKLEDRWSSLRSWNHIYGHLNRTDHRVPLGYRHMRGVGGTTLVFAAEAHRLHPESMKMKSRFGVAADWPLDYDELEPYYTEAERIIGVAGPAGDARRFRSAPYPLPAHPLSYASSKISEGCRGLGLTLSSNPVAILSAPYDGRPRCNYCANCSRGCPLTDKGSTDVTFVRKAVASGSCTVKADCQVVRLGAGPSDRVTGVEYVDGEGRTHAVSGGAVVVSCGTIETPRLLLASANRHAPEGPGNESGHVGRHFMETISWGSSGLYPEPLGSHRGLPSDSICWDYDAPDAIPGVIGGCRFSVATAEADFHGPINYAHRVVPGWGREHKREMRRVFGSVLTIAGIGESLPNEKTFVDLDPEEKDALGIPLARIHSFVDEMALDRTTFMMEKGRAILMASGVEKIFEEYGNYDYFNAPHVFGTCRMGDVPQESVVNAFGRSHRWRNLFVADTSVFPSSGGGESPSLTAEALAIRTADYIRDVARKGEL